MKKIVTLLLIALLVFSVTQIGIAEEPVKIGVMTWYTGSRADLGVYVCDAIELAVSEVNAAGGILGGRPIEVVYEDCGEDQQSAITGIMKLINTDGISAIVGPFITSHVLAASQMVTEAEIPFVALGASSTQVAEENDYFIITRLTDDQAAPICAKYASEVMGMKNPAVISLNASAGQSWVEAFNESWKQYGTIAIELMYDNETEKEYSSYIAQIMGSGADGIIANCQQSDAGLIMRAVYNAGCDLPCLGAGSANASAVALEIAAEAANGWKVLTEWSSFPNTEKSIAFEEAYEAAAGRPANVNAATIYDAFNLIVHAIDAAGSTESAAIMDAVRKTKDFEGVVTTYTYDGYKSFANSEMLVEITDGKPVVIGSFNRTDR